MELLIDLIIFVGILSCLGNSPGSWKYNTEKNKYIELGSTYRTVVLTENVENVCNMFLSFSKVSEMVFLLIQGYIPSC